MILVVYRGLGGFSSGQLHLYFFFKSVFGRGLNPFTTGHPFVGTKLLGFSIVRGSGALKGLSSHIEEPQKKSGCTLYRSTCPPPRERRYSRPAGCTRGRISTRRGDCFSKVNMGKNRESLLLVDDAQNSNLRLKKLLSVDDANC